MTELLTLLSMVLSLFTAVDVDGLLARRREEIRALEVYVGDDRGLGCDPNAPRWIIVQVHGDDFTIGEEDRWPVQVSSWQALQAQLGALKGARKDRETVFVDVDDDVDYGRIARVVDLLTGTEMRAILLHATPSPSPTPERWSLPRSPG